MRSCANRATPGVAEPSRGRASTGADFTVVVDGEVGMFLLAFDDPTAGDCATDHLSELVWIEEQEKENADPG